jgi:hypothetical protein
MDIIHFTHGATDPLIAFDSKGAHFLPLADGAGDTHLSCVHFDPGAIIEAPPLTHAATLLVVHGRITITRHQGGEVNLAISGGMGVVFRAAEPYSLKSKTGAILMVVECAELRPHLRGISSPERINGQTWPSDILLPHSKAFP